MGKHSAKAKWPRGSGSYSAIRIPPTPRKWGVRQGKGSSETESLSFLGMSSMSAASMCLQILDLRWKASLEKSICRFCRWGNRPKRILGLTDLWDMARTGNVNFPRPRSEHLAPPARAFECPHRLHSLHGDRFQRMFSLASSFTMVILAKRAHLLMMLWCSCTLRCTSFTVWRICWFPVKGNC